MSAPTDNLMTNEDVVKALASLAKSVESIQDDIVTLKRGPTHSGVNPQLTSSQQSYIGSAGSQDDNPPPHKKTRVDTDEDEDDLDNIEEPAGQLVTLSEAATAFLEASFSSKLSNDNRKAKTNKHGIPDSRWTRCPKIDAMVAANVSPAAKKSDRAASRLQQFWLDATIPLVLLLERAEELGLPNEAITAIQTSLQLMGNANHHNTVSRRNALLMQLNPKLKPLFTDADFQQVAPFLFGEKFGPLAKERLDAANALKKATFTEKGGFRGFQKSHPQKNYGRGGGYQYHSGQSSKGWQANKANKPKK